MIWDKFLTTSKLLCSTFLEIKGVCSLKFNIYTGKNTGNVRGAGRLGVTMLQNTDNIDQSGWLA